MRTFIKEKLRTTSTAKIVVMVTVITLILAILLTAITSMVMLKELSKELILANIVIGLIIPLIIAPFMTNLIKEATIWERANQELKSENIERKRLEDEATQRARDMQSINHLAVECAAATPDADIIKLIAEKLRDITNALGVAITIYDQETRTLTTKHIAVSNQSLKIANKLVGYNLIGMVYHITPEMEKHMLKGTVDTFSDLSEVSFGAIPKPVATLIKNTLGVGAFTGLAISYASKLIGTAIIVHKDGQPLVDLDICKTLAHVSAVSIQRKNTEDALRESETKFRTLIENLSEGMLLLDEQGRIIEWNPAQAALTGFKPGDVVGKPVWDVQFQLTPECNRTPDFYEMMEHQSRSILTSGEFANFNRPQTGVIHSKDGDVKHILQTSFPIQTDSGKYRIGAIMRDITSQRLAEKDREDLIAELKAKNSELEQFTYTVSHDLKAPIITIKGFLGLLEKDMLDGKADHAKKDMLRINEAAEKMHILLNELLELSRIGRFVNPSQNMPFDKIVQDAISAVRGNLDAHKVMVNIAKNLPSVFVDQTRLVQVMQNLLDNSAKFMGEQTNPVVEIGTSGIANDGKQTFFVKDNGKGIAPDQIERVFGLFQKLDISAEGTGVGLALVKRIIEVHDGRVWITSKGLGHGTTVWFTLPVS